MSPKVLQLDGEKNHKNGPGNKKLQGINPTFILNYFRMVAQKKPRIFRSLFLFISENLLLSAARVLLYISSDFLHRHQLITGRNSEGVILQRLLIYFSSRYGNLNTLLAHGIL